MKQNFVPSLLVLLLTVYGNLTPIIYNQVDYYLMSFARDQIYLISNNPQTILYQFNITNNTFIQQKSFSSYIETLSVNSRYIFVDDNTNLQILQLSLDFNQLHGFNEQNMISTFVCNDDFLFVGGLDFIEKWNISSMTLIDHVANLGDVWAIIISNNSIYDYQTNNYAIIEERDINNLTVIKNQFVGHMDGIDDLLIYDDYLFSASSDDNIIQWNLTNQQKIKTFTGHTSAVLCLTASKGYLFSSSCDLTWKQWDISSGTLIRSENPYSGNIFGLYIFNQYLYIAGEGGFYQYLIPELIVNTTSTTTTTTATTKITTTPTTIPTTSITTSTRTNTSAIATTSIQIVAPTSTTFTTTSSSNYFAVGNSTSILLSQNEKVFSTMIVKPITKENSNTGQSQDANIGYYVGAPIMALVLLFTVGFIALHFIKRKKKEKEEKN